MTFPIQPQDTRNPPEKLTADKWALIQKPCKEVREINVLTATPEEFKEAMRRI